MLDIGFVELLVVAVLGLLVIGPKQLPSAIQKITTWIFKARRSINNFKMALEKEVGADEIREQVRSESIQKHFEQNQEKLKALDENIQSKNIELMDSLSFSEEQTPAKKKRINPDILSSLLH